ncbi:MAG: hypothetical protein SOZ59_01080 [Candidatus Limivivens sp.]|nr:hypothetical protein [Candidatus Limivivens sp.]
MESLFERFGVELPENVEDVNLIGVDFGDGEVSAALARVKDGKIDNDPLFPDSTRAGYKCPNVLFIPSDRSLPWKMGIGNFQNGKVYYNFKKCPGTNEARTRYRMDNGQSDEYTYEEIMKLAFQQFIRLLFTYNAHAISREKRTILVVGRPAGSKWKKREKEYAELLMDGLKIEGYEKPIDIVVVSESLAAFARETNPKLPEEKRIQRGETVLIVDCGSSTFDVTLVTEDRIPEDGEYSRQFGGGMIEDLMLQCFCLGKEPPEDRWPGRLLRLRQYCGEGRHTPDRMVCSHHKLELRKKKEDYYGKTGEDGTDTGIYAVFFEPESETEADQEYESWFIKKPFMGQVLYRMPVRAGSASLLESEESVRTFPSWYAAGRSVFREASRQMEKYLRGRPADKVILTGGVSAMPEVRRLVKECFGREPIMAELPNYSVVEGLAYVAALEVLKHRELLELTACVRKILSECAQSMELTVARYAAFETYRILIRTMADWKEDPKDSSLLEWKQRFQEACREELEIGRAAEEGLLLWYRRDGIEEKINQSLKERFDSLFPGFEDKFCFQIDRKAVINTFQGTEVKLHIHPMRVFGIINGWRPGRIRSSLERKYCYEKAKSRAEKIQRDLTGAYQSQLNIRENIQEQLLEALEPSLKAHVEYMTPYFHMMSQGTNGHENSCLHGFSCL